MNELPDPFLDQATPTACHAIICAGARDDIAVPMHAYKLTAAIQHAQAGPEPILLRVGREDGHYPSGVEPNLELWADQLAFLVKVLDIEVEDARN